MIISIYHMAAKNEALHKYITKGFYQNNMKRSLSSTLLYDKSVLTPCPDCALADIPKN